MSRRLILPISLVLACKGKDADDSSSTGTPPDDSATGDDTGTKVDEEGAYLASLTLSQGTLTPPFSSGQRHYQVNASQLQDASTLVEATPTNPDATVTITHASMDGVAITEGASPLHAPFIGSERLDIEVTAGDESRTYTVVALPPTFPPLDVRAAEPGAWDGYIFLGSFPTGGAGDDYSPYVFIVDRTGTPVWFRETPGPGLDFKPNPDHTLSYVGVAEGKGPGFWGFVLDETYAVAEQLRPIDADMDHREFLGLPDGNRVLLGTTVREADLTKWGGNPGCCSVEEFRFQEFDPSGKLVFEWRAQDHIDELFGDLPKQRLDNLTDQFDYAHVNSLDLDPVDGNWILSLRFVSHVLKVARYETEFKGVTYKPGDIIWKLGGKNADWTIEGDDRAGGWQGFSDQHNARMPEAGRILVYDNAYWADIGDTGDSRYVEYTLDETTMVATKVNEYAIAGSGSTGICGSAERLPDGSTVIGWGNLNSTYLDAPAMTEVDAKGNVLLDIGFPPGELTYRAGVGTWDADAHAWSSL